MHKVINPNSPFFGQMGYNYENIYSKGTFNLIKRRIGFPKTKEQFVFWIHELEYVETDPRFIK